MTIANIVENKFSYLQIMPTTNYGYKNISSYLNDEYLTGLTTKDANRIVSDNNKLIDILSSVLTELNKYDNGFVDDILFNNDFKR